MHTSHSIACCVMCCLCTRTDIGDNFSLQNRQIYLNKCLTAFKYQVPSRHVPHIAFASNRIACRTYRHFCLFGVFSSFFSRILHCLEIKGRRERRRKQPKYNQIHLRMCSRVRNSVDFYSEIGNGICESLRIFVGRIYGVCLCLFLCLNSEHNKHLFKVFILPSCSTCQDKNEQPKTRIAENK